MLSIDCCWVRGGVGGQLPRYRYWSQKFIFQFSTINPHGINERSSFNWNILVFSSPTNSIALFSAYKPHNPHFLQLLWRRANVRNVSLLTLFMFSNQLLTLNYLYLTYLTYIGNYLYKLVLDLLTRLWKWWFSIWLIYFQIDSTNPPNINCQDMLGNTPLHCAAYRYILFTQSVGQFNPLTPMSDQDGISHNISTIA